MTCPNLIRRLWSSSPVIPGMWMSAIKQPVSGRRGDDGWRKSARVCLIWMEMRNHVSITTGRPHSRKSAADGAEADRPSPQDRN